MANSKKNEYEQELRWNLAELNACLHAWLGYFEMNVKNKRWQQKKQKKILLGKKKCEQKREKKRMIESYWLVRGHHRL